MSKNSEKREKNFNVSRKSFVLIGSLESALEDTRNLQSILLRIYDVFQTVMSLCEGKRCQDNRILETVLLPPPPRIYKTALILCVNCGFPYKISFEEMVHSMAKTVQKPQTFLIRDNLQGLYA